MAKIMHAQTVLTDTDLDALKKKTSEENTKDALAKAVQHFLDCNYTQMHTEDMWAKKLENVVKRNTQKKTV